MINEGLQKEAKSTYEEMFKGKAKPMFNELPEQGLSYEEIRKILTLKKSEDVVPNEGKIFSLVYDKGKQHNDFLTEANNMFLHTNGLSPMAFISIKNIEVEIVAMTAKMFHGNENCVGSVTTGGSESLMLAVKTYNSRWKHRNPHLRDPQLIKCVTGHPAMDKACEYFGIKTIQIDYDRNTFRMQVKDVEKAINKHTIAIFVSAPQYPHGVVDPIEEISEIGFKYNIPVHVDSAIGGFVLPFLESLHYPIPVFDFRLRGVTSMNADVHKYGYSVKGVSTVIYRNSEIRKFQLFSFSTWPGGFMIAPTVLGSRGGGAMAAAYASLLSLGKSGFKKTVQDIMETTIYIKNEIQKIPELQVMGDPHMTLIAICSKTDKLNIVGFHDILNEMGWKPDLQRLPNCIHLTIMPQHVEIKEQIVADIKKAIQIYFSDPKKWANTKNAGVYGMLAKVPDEKLIDDFLKNVLDLIYTYPKSDKKQQLDVDDKKNM